MNKKYHYGDRTLTPTGKKKIHRVMKKMCIGMQELSDILGLERSTLWNCIGGSSKHHIRAINGYAIHEVLGFDDSLNFLKLSNQVYKEKSHEEKSLSEEPNYFESYLYASRINAISLALSPERKERFFTLLNVIFKEYE